MSKRKLEFWVTVCLGHGDGGDVLVDIEVNDQEYKLLKLCYQEDNDIDSYEGLESLYERVVDEAIAVSDEFESDIDYDDASYTVHMPESICDEVVEEEEE